MSDTPAIAGFRVVSQDAWEAGLAACEEYRSKLDKLERENAALRDALDCIAGKHGERSPVTLTEAQEEARAALSTRKEAQP